MKGPLMSINENKRACILDRVKNKQISLRQAAEEMEISYSHSKRLLSAFKKEGAQALISKKRGKSSNRAIPEEKKKEIAYLIRENYRDCYPLYISEKLDKNHKMKYSSEFIRQLMINYQLWTPNKKRARIHPSRPRREREGELLQTDASDHNWLESRGPRCHLHIYVDDATSRIVGGYFDLEETTRGYFMALLPVLQNKGAPRGIYADKRQVFVANNKEGGKTEFRRAMGELGIQMITAHSPQAKGRIERAFKTLQQRLIWELREKQISTLEEANKYLPEFLKEYNQKFAEEPKNPENAYKPLDKSQVVKHILCWKESRVVTKNLEISYQNEIYQLSQAKQKLLDLKKGSKVTVIVTLEGELKIEFNKKFIPYKKSNEIDYRLTKKAPLDLKKVWPDKRSNKPPKSHPWRKKFKKLESSKS